MNRKYLTLIIIALAILVPFFVFISTSAKGPTVPDKVVIIGPGLESPLEITNGKTLEMLAFAGFENIHRPIKEPDHIGVDSKSYAMFMLDLTSWQSTGHFISPKLLENLVMFSSRA